MSVSSATALRPTRTRRPKRDEVRQRLLEAAKGVLVSHGYGAASVDTITEAAGLSRGALYSNFVDKEDLYICLLDTLERAQVDEMAALYDKHQSIDQFLTRVANRGAAPNRDPRGHLILQTELWLLGTRNEKVRERLAAIQRRTIEAIATVVEGTVLGFTSHEWAAVVFALGDGLMMQRVTDPASLQDDLLIDLLRSLASLAGITPGAGP